MLGRPGPQSAVLPQSQCRALGCSKCVLINWVKEAGNVHPGYGEAKRKNDSRKTGRPEGLRTKERLCLFRADGVQASPALHTWNLSQQLFGLLPPAGRWEPGSWKSDMPSRGPDMLR